jgi:hypothetical protein
MSGEQLEYNLALGERRANAARDYLQKLGVDASRMSVISYGEERPLDPSSGESAWAEESSRSNTLFSRASRLRRLVRIAADHLQVGIGGYGPQGFGLRTACLFFFAACQLPTCA